MTTPAPEYEMIYSNEHRDETIGGLLIGLAVPRRSRASLMENTFILRSSKRRDANDAMLRRKWLEGGRLKKNFGEIDESHSRGQILWWKLN